MLVAEKLVFVELHRTGASKLQKLLAEVGGQEEPGKFPALAGPLAALGKPVIGYVCDPLAWYYFQWKQGCAGKGELHKRLTDPARWTALAAKHAARTEERGKSNAALEIPEGWGAQHATGVWYASSDNPSAFREWLRAVLLTPAIRRVVSPAYQHSPLHKSAGLMTFEYFSAFVQGVDQLAASGPSHDDLWALNQERAITGRFVRAESTAADLMAVLGELGISLTEAQQSAAQALDKAGRQKQVDAFYNDEARQWVQKSDAVMVRLFGRNAVVGAGGSAGAVASTAEPAPAPMAAPATPAAMDAKAISDGSATQTKAVGKPRKASASVRAAEGDHSAEKSPGTEKKKAAQPASAPKASSKPPGSATRKSRSKSAPTPPDKQSAAAAPEDAPVKE